MDLCSGEMESCAGDKRISEIPGSQKDFANQSRVSFKTMCHKKSRRIENRMCRRPAPKQGITAGKNSARNIIFLHKKPRSKKEGTGVSAALKKTGETGKGDDRKWEPLIKSAHPLCGRFCALNCVQNARNKPMIPALLSLSGPKRALHFGHSSFDQRFHTLCPKTGNALQG